MKAVTQVRFDDLLAGYGWVSASPDGANSAFVSRVTGGIHCLSSDTELDDEPPEDIEDGSLYVGIPHQHDLNLGRDLVLAFSDEQLAESIHMVQGFFRQRGAYSKFKNLLERQGLLQTWYDYEANATEAALREWCALQGISVATESSNDLGSSPADPPPVNLDSAAEGRKKMTRQIVFTPKAGKPPPMYSQAVKAAGLVFVSGTAPTDPASGAFKGTTIQEQTRQCLTNIQAILEEAGSSLDKIVSVTVVLAEEDDFAGMNEEWLLWFPANPPARQGAKLPARIPGLKVSIAAIAEA